MRTFRLLPLAATTVAMLTPITTWGEPPRVEVLIFSADYCKPCKPFAKKVQQAAAEHPTVQVNVITVDRVVIVMKRREYVIDKEAQRRFKALGGKRFPFVVIKKDAHIFWKQPRGKWRFKVGTGESNLLDEVKRQIRRAIQRP